jgi:hypothetical protein
MRACIQIEQQQQQKRVVRRRRSCRNAQSIKFSVRHICIVLLSLSMEQCACGYRGKPLQVQLHQSLTGGACSAGAAGAHGALVHCKCGLSLSSSSMPAHLLRFRAQASLHGQVEPPVQAPFASPRSRSARTAVVSLPRAVPAPARAAEPPAAPSSGKRKAEAEHPCQPPVAAKRSPAKRTPAKRSTPLRPTRGSLLLAQADAVHAAPAAAPLPSVRVNQMAPGKLKRSTALLEQAREGDAREMRLASAAAADVHTPGHAKKKGRRW